MPPHSLDSQTTQPFRVAAGILDYVLRRSPFFFQPEHREAQGKFILQCCWNVALRPVPSLRVSGLRAPVILIQREVLDSL